MKSISWTGAGLLVGLACAMGCAEDGAAGIDEPEESSPGISVEAQAEWDLANPDGGVGSGPNGRKLPFGSVVGTFCGVDAHSNGPTTPSGHVDGSTIYGFRWQCTEYAFRFLCTHYNPLGCEESGKNGKYGNAKFWFPNTENNPILASLTRYENNGVEPPRAGDILTFGNGVYGHVAVIKRVVLDSDSPYVEVIEQNVTGTVRDGGNRHQLHVADGRYRITNAQGWMRVPNSAAACGTTAPVLQTPNDAATFAVGESIEFGWALGNPEENHTLHVEHLDSDTVVYERDLGQLLGARTSFDAPGDYQWFVSFEGAACGPGDCTSSVWRFTVLADEPDPEPNPAPEPEPGAESCNGIDDDADGRVDEDLVRSWGAYGACGGFDGVCDPGGEQSRARDVCVDGEWRVERATRACERDTDGTPCADGRCVDGRCEADGLGFHLEIEPDGWTDRGTCDTAISRELYRGRILSHDVDQNSARMEFRKCDDGLPSQDLTAWIVVSDVEFITENQLCTSADCTRATTRWSSRDARLTVDDVRLWPNAGALRDAACDTVKRFYIVTDGRGREGMQTWYQAQSIGVRKVCD